MIGVVELVDCVRDYPSPWAVPGQWHRVLANPRPFRTPIPARGQPGLWEWEPPKDGLEDWLHSAT
ncbi:MAG TPA: hypothetical protein VFD01_08075 [Candidatus Dormibacteraeota bacterium]|nr:hypothetical protein [Candidatus Dormibacteraeota bacterium]